MQNKFKLLVAISLFTASARFGLPAHAVPEQMETPGQATADSTFRGMPFKMGASLNVNLLKHNAQYRQLAAAQFSSVTAENAMKFSSLQPQQGHFTFDNADYLVSFAQQNGQRVHGHTLLWHQQLPRWVAHFTGDSASLEAVMRTHIQTVVSHFRGKVVSWDVVNEAFEDNGILRNTIWRQKLGPDYIARAFQYAHAADPDAKLFYNDYGHEYSSAKRTAVNNLLASLVSRGIPVHGTGLQMHTRYNQADANLAAAIQTAAATGLLVHISEIDVALNPDNKPSLELTPALAVAQAAKYAFVVRQYNAIPAPQQFGITIWNLTDGDSWLRATNNRPDWPLPFDANYQPKPAYDSIRNALKH